MAKSSEKFKTSGGVFDVFTDRLLFVIESKGFFDSLGGPIFVGKESNVFDANTQEGGKVIVKIYRLETCDFNRMYDYIKYDRRYLSLRKQKRKVIFAWAQREYRNLLIAREAGVRVPTPLHRAHHILILEHIGDKKPAPQLKDANILDPRQTFDDIVQQLKKLYHANLIHGDLSQFNILYHNNQPVIIDFSQSTTKENPRAQEYLERDIRNICAFFRKQGIESDEEEVLATIIAP